ncbi:response regulator [Cohnella caldifontis]|uniref:response regulator n=1 Tax=Cohnella caldifontis TaxID=3027471 RepID=UPI0023EAAA76|nr:response regulator [Cohnella sp. YIM B05605]
MFSVLIVDDHRHLVESLTATFPWHFYDITAVYPAFSGKEAIRFLDSERGAEIDIVLTDIRMPEISGLELIEAIRARGLNADCVLISGYADFQYARKAIELQTAHYLMKPVRDEELSDVLRAIVGRRKAARNEILERERAKAALHGQLEQLKSDLLMAQSLTEISILKERNRIAEDLHDLVGHTLTTTLVQIESAKRLLAKKPEEGMHRLDISQELVRKSLEDIREAVRKMRHMEVDTDLRSILLHFARETERAAGVRIEHRLPDSMPNPDPVRKRLIFHAFQEGVTNGIRHGGAGFFRLDTEESDGCLAITLWNDGAPYSETESGFGLRTMKERAEGVGGGMRIEGTADPAGTRLTIWCPVNDRDGAKETER